MSSNKFQEKSWILVHFKTIQEFPEWYRAVPSQISPGFSWATGPENSSLVLVPPIQEVGSGLVLSRLKKKLWNADPIIERYKKVLKFLRQKGLQNLHFTKQLP